MTNNKLKKALSLVLTLVMVLTMIPALTAGLYNRALALEVKSATAISGDLKFIVPEVIYLTPDARSWNIATTSTFQFYVNNDQNGNPAAEAAQTTGKIYYSLSDAGNGTISYQFFNQGMTGTLSGSVSLSSNSITNGGSVNVTGGTAPSLAAATTGCYLRWELSYHDNKDNQDKKAYAWSYVYKPYVIPVAAAAQAGCGTIESSCNMAGSLTSVSGFHSIIVDGMPGYSYNDSNNGYEANNFLKFTEADLFVSSSNKARVGGTEVTSTTQGVSSSSWVGHDSSKAGEQRYLSFANTSGTPKNYAYVLVEDNRAPTSYNNGSSDTSQNWGIQNTTFYKYWGNNKDIVTKSVAKSIGAMVIDVSRYNNLNQIPNLGVALVVTMDKGCDNNTGRWWMSDISETEFNHRSTWYKSGEDNLEPTAQERDYIFASQGNHYQTRSYDTNEGVRYCGSWYRTLLNTNASSQMYYVKSLYGNAEKSAGSNYDANAVGYVGLQATYNNKASLRTAVQNAIKAMAKLGVSGDDYGNLQSMYFDTTGEYNWGALQTAYKNAVMALTRVDASYTDCGTRAEALNNALSNLKTKVTLNSNGGTFTGSGATTYWVKVGTSGKGTVNPSGTYDGTKPGYSLARADKRWSLDPNANAGASSVSVGYNNTVYAVWVPNSYSVGFNGGPNSSGSMSAQGFTYGEAKALSENRFARSYTLTMYRNHSSSDSTTSTLQAPFSFDGWDGQNFVEDNITHTGSCGSTGYTNVWEVSVEAPYGGFKEGDRYVFEFDAKGSGEAFSAFFYGNSGYREVASAVCSNGQTSTSSDGNVTIAPTADYTHYVITYTLSGNGNGSVTKKLLLRAQKNTSMSFTNIKAHRIFADGETVQNLAVNGNYTLTARWLDPSAITLPAPTARTGYTFDGWFDQRTGGNKIGDANDPITLNGNRQVYAHWSVATYTITYVEGENTDVYTYSYNTSNSAYTLRSSTPPDGHDFNGWKVTVTDGNWPAVGTVLTTNTSTAGSYGNVTLTAQYSPKSYTVDVAINGAGGTITGVPENVTHGGGPYTFGVTLEPGYDTVAPQVFADNCTCTLSGSGSSYTATISNVTDNIYVRITPQATQYTVTVDAGDGVTVDEEHSVLEVEYNGTATLIVTLNEGYKDPVAMLGGTALTPSVSGSTYTYTITGVKHPVTVNLSATRKSFTVNFNASPAATYSFTEAQTVYYGEDLTFTVTMNAGYTQTEPTVKANSDVLTKISGSNGVYTYKIEDIKETKQVQVLNAQLNTYTVQVTTDQGLEAVASATVNHGDSYVLTLTLKEGFTANAPTARIGTTPLTLTQQSDAVYTCTITNISNNIIIDAFSNVNEYYVTVTGDAGAALSETAFNNVTHGETVTFTVTLNEGYTQTAPVVKNGNTEIPYASVDGFTYTYSIAVAADMTITVTTAKNKYTVRFLLPDGETELLVKQVEHGDTPAYDGDAPETVSDATNHYVFNNQWTPAFGPITGDTDYTAVVTGTPHTWDDGAETLAPKCFADGVKTYTCTTCGRTRTETIGQIGHHTWNEGVITTQPTCTEAGVKTFTCTVCNETYTETVEASGHSFGAWLPYDGTKHVHYCRNNPAHKEFAEHNWDEGVYSEGFSCTSGGTQTYTCSDCGATRVENIAANQRHTWGAWETIKRGNDDHFELQRRTCQNCGAIQEQDVPFTGTPEQADPSSVGKLNRLSFWEWILSIFHRIVALFQKMHF